MSLLALSFLASTAFADDVCLGAACLDVPLREALSAAGVDDVDGLAILTDGRKDWLTVTSSDGKALTRAFPSAKVARIGDLTAWVVTVPLDLDVSLGLETMKPDIMDILIRRGGGGGGGGSTCVEVCVCTPTGVECWLEC